MKAFKVMENLERILAIELYTAAQAIDFRRPAKSSPYLESFLSHYRKKVSFINNDKVMFEDINMSVEFLRKIELAPELNDQLL